MTAEQLDQLGPALARFLDRFVPHFRSTPTFHHLHTYTRGLLSDLPRKNSEPIALYAGVAVRTLQEFLRDHVWSFEQARDVLQRHVAGQLLDLPGDDPAASTPASMYGNIGLGTYLSPGQYNWDMSLSKLIKIRETESLEFRGEFFNTFNHPQFSFNPVDDPAFAAQDSSAGNFGQVTVSSVNPRLIQFVLKFLF